jgi:hypothetical protein
MELSHEQIEEIEARLAPPFKAKTLASIYREYPVVDTLKLLALNLVTETGELLRQRGAKSDSALIAVLRQQEDKWKAFCRRAADIEPEPSPGAFRKVLLLLIPLAKGLDW